MKAAGLAERRRTLRAARFELTAELRDDFLRLRSAAQRNWLISRLLEETASDLTHLNELAQRFVAGSERPEIAHEWQSSRADLSAGELRIEGQQVMQAWERPYMEAMAAAVAASHGEVLEVGFGLGISATAIQNAGVRSHTIIECHHDVLAHATAWQAAYPGRDIRLVSGRWQDAIDALGEFDGIFFDTYPLTEDEFNDHMVEDVTFARHFFAAAARHLRTGGVFVYYSNEIDSVSRRHQRGLFEHFRSVTFSVCRPLHPPADCNYWWADSMVVAMATK
ncbi:MAG: class I SAM-dependent methyltransferase [Vicinamibacterales bacterium]